MDSTAEWKGQRNNNELEIRTEITQSEKQRENSRVKNKQSLRDFRVYNHIIKIPKDSCHYSSRGEERWSWKVFEETRNENFPNLQNM